MAVLPGAAPSVRPRPLPVDFISGRAGATTLTIGVTLAGGIPANGVLIQFYAFGVNEGDTIALPGALSPLVNNGTSLNRVVYGARLAASEGSATFTFTKTGTAGAWRVAAWTVQGAAVPTAAEVSDVQRWGITPPSHASFTPKPNSTGFYFDSIEAASVTNSAAPNVSGSAFTLAQTENAATPTLLGYTSSSTPTNFISGTAAALTAAADSSTSQHNGMYVALLAP